MEALHIRQRGPWSQPRAIRLGVPLHHHACVKNQLLAKRRPRSLEVMDEGERDLLGCLVVEHQAGIAPQRTWTTLRCRAIGALWGRSRSSLEVEGVDAWALRAEVSR